MTRVEYIVVGLSALWACGVALYLTYEVCLYIGVWWFEGRK